MTLKPDTFYHVLYDICKGLAHHGFKKIAILNCHGGNSPIIQVLSRELRSELGIAVFIINCGVFFGNQAVKDTVTPGNVWDFHGGEMETSMVLAERPETVKLETSEAVSYTHLDVYKRQEQSSSCEGRNAVDRMVGGYSGLEDEKCPEDD